MEYDKTSWDDLPKGMFKTLEQILTGKGDWPEAIRERFKNKFVFDDIILNAASPEAGELISLFEKEKGFKPFSYLEGRYKYSKAKPSPFKFFWIYVKTGAGAAFRMVDNTNFENQMDCDYPANPVMICGNKGCGRWKKQIAPFQLDKKPGKIPKSDFFIFWAGPHLPDSRIYGISAKAREAILRNGIDGCEIRPLLSHEGIALSEIFQLTITGETCGAIPVKDSLSEVKPCVWCGYISTQWDSPLSLGNPIYADSFFSEKDLQICDKVLVEGKRFRGFNMFPRLCASTKFIQMYMEYGLKGLSFGPVNLLSEIQAAGFLDEAMV
jgi:hypothetical protein